MSQAARQQAAIATGPIGTPDEVRQLVRTGAQVLHEISASIARDPEKVSPQIVAMLAADTAEVSSGLDAIADSKTDDQFVASVFNMCDAQRQVSAPRVGQFLVAVANAIRAKPPANVPPQQFQAQATYFNTFGERMINIPTECDRAQAAMADASAREEQAEAQHQAHVAAALNAAELLFAGTVV